MGDDDIRVGFGGILPKWGSQDYPSWLDEDSLGGADRVFEARVESCQIDSAFPEQSRQMLFCPCQKAVVSSVVSLVYRVQSELLHRPVIASDRLMGRLGRQLGQKRP